MTNSRHHHTRSTSSTSSPLSNSRPLSVVNSSNFHAASASASPSLDNQARSRHNSILNGNAPSSYSPASSIAIQPPITHSNQGDDQLTRTRTTSNGSSTAGSLIDDGNKSCKSSAPAIQPNGSKTKTRPSRSNRKDRKSSSGTKSSESTDGPDLDLNSNTTLASTSTTSRLSSHDPGFPLTPPSVILGLAGSQPPGLHSLPITNATATELSNDRPNLNLLTDISVSALTAPDKLDVIYSGVTDATEFMPLAPSVRKGSLASKTTLINRVASGTPLISSHPSVNTSHRRNSSLSSTGSSAGLPNVTTPLSALSLSSGSFVKNNALIEYDYLTDPRSPLSVIADKVDQLPPNQQEPVKRTLTLISSYLHTPLSRPDGHTAPPRELDGVTPTQTAFVSATGSGSASTEFNSIFTPTPTQSSQSERSPLVRTRLPLDHAWTLFFSDTSTSNKPQSRSHHHHHHTTSLLKAAEYQSGMSQVFSCIDNVESLCVSLVSFKTAMAANVKRGVMAHPGFLHIGARRTVEESLVVPGNGLGLVAMKIGQNLHFFRVGVNPVWEDPWNAKVRAERLVFCPDTRRDIG